jgi:hypothetical protein
VLEAADVFSYLFTLNLKIMSLKKLFGLVFLPFLLASINLGEAIQPAFADKEDGAIYEDKLTTGDGLRWGGPSLPYRKAVDIKDSLVNLTLGKVTADRSSEGGEGTKLSDLLFGPYNSPTQGRTVVISLWGSKLEGCFLEMVVQHVPMGDRIDTESIFPKLLEMGIGSQLIELPPQSSVKPKVFSQEYSYTVGSEATKRLISGTWYMTRTLFLVDAGIADILRNAPPAEVRARLTMQNGSKILVPIKKETVASWKKAYSFNPTCQNPEIAARQRELANKPLLRAFNEYTGTPSQDAAFYWLEKQIQPVTLIEFAKRWRGETASGKRQPLRLANAGKFYKHLPNQDEALEWLQSQLTPTASSLFAKKWK